MDNLLNSIRLLIKQIKTIYISRKFRSVGRKSHIEWPLRIQDGKNISIGSRCHIGKLCWLAAMPLTSSTNCRLTIGDGCQIGDLNHVFCTSSITFEEEVLTANGVYITDNLHDYSNPRVSVMHQPIKQLKPVVIGRGCWIGENVSIIGASIGRNSVIGANSVVTHSIPDYCVAVGAPARIIKRYNFNSGAWEKVSDL